MNHTPPAVVAGLDPATHAALSDLRPVSMDRGSSPRMTRERMFQAHRNRFRRTIVASNL
jgi:hypothetical protein